MANEDLELLILLESNSLKYFDKIKLQNRFRENHEFHDMVLEIVRLKAICTSIKGEEVEVSSNYHLLTS